MGQEGRLQPRRLRVSAERQRMKQHPARRPCGYHEHGVPPEVKPTDFCQRGCPKCEKKIAAGVVTGKEPPPRERGRKQIKRVLDYLAQPNRWEPTWID